MDGGRELAAEQHAHALAEAAARALSAGGLHRGTLVVDPARATAVAEGMLASAGHPGQVSVTGGTVTVAWSEPTDLLSLVGIDHVGVRATARATDVNGTAAP
ncbi:MAG: hypothetical protein ACYDH5_18180 [Acidimicrobiales bacterium]